MFAYILRVHTVPSAATDDLFRRFKETPGLLHAYSLQGVDDPAEGEVVAIWDSRDSAEAYLRSQFRQQVDQSIPGVTRTMYEVRDSK